MTKLTPLFAVVTLGLGGSIAGASPAAMTPRTLPSGAPACGNAQTKGPRRCVDQPAAVAPRTLVTGAPACGNVLDKVDGNTRDPVYQACLAGGASGLIVEATLQVRRVVTLLGLVGTRLTAAAPRQLRDGAPACGNVATRTPRRRGGC